MCAFHAQVFIWCAFLRVSVCGLVLCCVCYESRAAPNKPFGNNIGLLLGIPCFPFLGTSCPSCNMITVTTIAVTVATEQVNKEEEEDEEDQRGGRREAELREKTGKARTVKFRAVGKEDRATGGVMYEGDIVTNKLFHIKPIFIP